MASLAIGLGLDRRRKFEAGEREGFLAACYRASGMHLPVAAIREANNQIPHRPPSKLRVGAVHPRLVLFAWYITGPRILLASTSSPPQSISSLNPLFPLFLP